MTNQTVQSSNLAYFMQWELLIYSALQDLYTGLNKIVFEEPYNQKIITTLLNSISQAQQLSNEQDIKKRENSLLTEISFIQNALNNIVYNKTMSSPEAEMYFFEAATLFKHLLTENTTRSFENFSIKTSQLPNDMVVKTASKINKSQKYKPSFLENIKKDSEKIISCPSEAVTWFEEQVYDQTFDHFYTHCVQLYNIIRNSMELSINEKNPDASQKKQTQLLIDMGLEALNSSESKNYLDKLSKHLGFANLQNLYENFHALNSQKEIDIYYQLKKNFFEKENLMFAKKTVMEELERINAISDLSCNESYYLIIRILGENYLTGIDACQHAKELVLNFAETYFKKKNIETKTKKHDAQLKNLIHEKFLFILANESILTEKIIKSITYQLNEDWLELRKKQTENERTGYNEILERVNSSSEEFILQHYLSSENTRSEAFKNYKNALNLNPHHEPVDEKKELDLASKEYKNYKNAVQYKTLKKVLNKKEIGDFIEEQNIKISAINKKIKSLREQIAIKNKMLFEFESSKRPMDFLLSAFRYKTSDSRQREITINEIQKNISSLKRECELAEWEFTFYHLSQKIIDEQLSTYSLIKDLSTLSLRREITQRLEEYIEIHKKIIACYMQSNPHEDIGEKLHGLEIEYIKTREIAQFTCDLLIEKLTKNPDGLLELANESVFELEKTYQILREQKIKISNFKNENETLLLNSIETLQPLVSTAIEKSMETLQKNKLPEYQEKIISQLKNKEQSTLEDPFEYLFKNIIQKNIPHFSRLNDSIFGIIEKVYCDFLEKNEVNFNIAELENIEIQLLKKYYFSNTKIEKLVQTNAYKNILSKIEKVINNKYQKIYSASFDIIRKTLRSLDDHFIRIYVNQLRYETKKKTVFNVYDVWLNKLFGYAPSTSIICDVQIAELAHTKAFYFFLERYLKALQAYQKNLFSSWNALKSSTLNAHMERVKKEYHVIQSELIKPRNDLPPIIKKIISTQNEILNFLENRKKTNHRQDFSILKNDRKKLLGKIKKLNQLSNKIEYNVIENNIFDEPLFIEFSMLLSEAKNEAGIAESNLAELEKTYTHDHSYYKNWLAKKLIFENTLQYIKSTLEKIENNEYHSFTLYSKINLHAVNDLYFDNPKYYGTALLLAIKKEDISLAEKLVTDHGKEISIQHLAAALNLALKNNQELLFYKIAEARKDISFSNTVLLDVVSDSIILNRQHFTLPILLNSNIELDAKTSTLLRQSGLAQKNHLPPVEKNFFQFFFDSDNSFLEGLRQCYTVEYALLLHLEAEYNALKLQKNVDDEQLIAFYNKMERASIIGQTLLHFYLNSHQFESIAPIRNEKHIKIWSSQVHELKTHYTQGLPNTLTSASYLKNLLFIKQKIFHTIDCAENATEIFLMLEEIKNFLKHKKGEQFFYILSESIIYAVNHDRRDALDIFLSYVEEPKLKRELAYNAFCQAIGSLQPECLKYLLRVKAYDYDINGAFAELSKLYYFTKDNPLYTQKILGKSLLIEALATLPLRFDPLLNDFIDFLAKVDDTRITRNPHRDLALTKIRNVYIFCEQAYYHIYQFESSQHFSAHQANVVRKLKAHLIKSIFEKTKPSAYQQAQIALWEDELKNISKECIKHFNATLATPMSASGI